MLNRFRQLVVWSTLAQVVLVGALGTGLHALLGCEHGACGSACCVADRDASACSHCVFCERADARREATPATPDRDALFSAARCDDCAVCDLLEKYRGATSTTVDAPAVELASGEAVLLRENAVIAAAIRLALSRGPPTA